MRFNCHFSRSVSLNHDTETEALRSSQRSLGRQNTQQKFGVLKYDFKVEHEPEGGKIRITIEPTHQIKDIIAK